MDKHAAIIGIFLESVNLFNEIEKQPKNYGTDEVIYNSEIDTLTIIGNAKCINLTMIAKELGISKSGSTRFVKKLVEKDLITKSKKEGNDKEVIFSLTDKGQIAFKEKEAFNKKMYASLYGTLARYVEHDLNRIYEFLSETNNSMRTLL